jgi:hypothetical protein
MLLSLEILSVLLVAVAMALSLAHALEWTGKLRLSKEEYLAMQPIYYPGFTIGGIAEPAGLLALLVLLFLTPEEGFWLLVGAFVALAAMHATYWLLTHPVNNFWLKDFNPKGLGGSFFAIGGGRLGEGADWTALRDRWETSHAIRAALCLLSLILLTASIAL